MNLSAYAAKLDVLHDRTAWLFTKERAPSDYVGDTFEWKPAGSVSCSALPVTDKMTIETYGPRVERMMCLHAAPGAPVADGMGVALTEEAAEPEYTVVSAKGRMTHTYVLIEAIDNGSSGQGDG